MSESDHDDIVDDSGTTPLISEASPIEKTSWVPLISRVILVFFVISVMITTIIFRKQVFHFLNILLSWIQSLGVWGAFILIFVYIAATIFLFPPFLLSLAGGFLYGYWALIIDTVGSSLGSVCAFLIGKYVIRSYVEGKIKDYPKFEIIDRAIQNEGFKIVALLRLCPIFPDSIANYLLSVTRIQTLPFITATIVGMFPGTCFLVYIGRSAQSLADIVAGKIGPSWKEELIFFLISSVFIVAFFVVSIRVAQNVLNQILKEQQDKMDNEIINDPSEIDDLEVGEQQDEELNVHSKSKKLEIINASDFAKSEKSTDKTD